MGPELYKKTKIMKVEMCKKRAKRRGLGLPLCRTTQGIADLIIRWPDCEGKGKLGGGGSHRVKKIVRGKGGPTVKASNFLKQLGDLNLVEA